MISVTRLALPYNQYLLARNWKKDIKPKDIKPLIANHQCMVYLFSCDLCDADYLSYTVQHFYQHIAEHENSAIGKHLLEATGTQASLTKASFKFPKSAKGNLIALSMRCFL